MSDIPVTDAVLTCDVPAGRIPPMPGFVVMSYGPQYGWTSDVCDTQDEAERSATQDVELGRTIVRVFRLPGGGA